MVRRFRHPVRIAAAGGKAIFEYAGRISGPIETVSIARMVAPGLWSEPFQTPSFDEVTVVVRGTIRVEHRSGATEVAAGEAVIVTRGERIRYSNPANQEAEYWAVCVPAFSEETAGRE